MSADAWPHRVLMTADTVGGVWTYSMELCRGLSARGVQITLATMGAPLQQAQRREVARIANLNVHESEWKLEWMENAWSDVARAGEWLLKIAGSVEPELVHLNGYVHAKLNWDGPVLVAGHSCVLSWWRAVKGAGAPPEWDRYAQAVADGLKAASMVVAPSQAMLCALEDHYGVNGTRAVIYNGRDPKLFRRGPKEEIVLTAGRIWDEGKNVGVVQRAAAAIKWPIYVAGDQQHPNGRGAELKHVSVLGRLNGAAMRSWLARASIFVLPARYEPFGLAALEAALSGCALVLGDIPSLREVWAECAAYVPPDNDRALAAEVNRLIAEASSRRHMASLAYQKAMRYSPDAMAGEYLKAYAAIQQREVACVL